MLTFVSNLGLGIQYADKTYLFLGLVNVGNAQDRHRCWCPSDSMIQAKSSHAIDLLIWKQHKEGQNKTFYIIVTQPWFIAIFL